MQKELKIGVAIGAVLLVVLIVYLAVPKGNENLATTVGDEGQTEEQNPAPTEKSSPAVEKNDQGTTAANDQRPPVDPFAPTNVGDEPRPENPTAANDPKEDVWAVLNTGEIVTSTPPLMVPTPKPTAPPAAEPKVEATAGETAAKPEPLTGSGAGTDTTEPVVDNGAKVTPEPASIDPQPQPISQASPRTHKVAKGETLSSIAKHVYGSERFYLAIEKANPGVDASRLRVGQTINLPEVDAVKKEETPAKPEASSEKQADSETEHVVKKGDNLHDIALKRLGNAALASDIYELNKSTIGGDSAKLKIGQVLKLPAKSALESSASR